MGNISSLVAHGAPAVPNRHGAAETEGVAKDQDRRPPSTLLAEAQSLTKMAIRGAFFKIQPRRL